MSILVKGQLKEAQIENLASDPTNLPHGRTWYDTALNKAKIAISGAAKFLVTEDGTQTLTNKTLTSPTINTPLLAGGTASNTSRITVPTNTKANLDALTRNVGTVVYGTDTLVPYFDNGTSLVAPLVNPMTTIGDVIYGGSAGAATRLAAGTLNQFLKSNAAAAPTWSYSIFGDVQSKTTTYTSLVSDGFIKLDASGGAFTQTIVSAVTAGAGKIQGFQKTDSSFNAITISGTGMTTNYLMTIGETVFYISDGTNWIQIYRKTDTDWISYTPTFAGLGTVTVDYSAWKRTSNGILVRGRATLGTTTGTTASLTIPNSGAWTTASTGSAAYGGIFTNNTASFNATTMGLILTNAASTLTIGQSGGGLLVSAAGTAMGASGNVISWYSSAIPITNFSS